MKKIVLGLLTLVTFIFTGCGEEKSKDTFELKMGIVPGIQSNEYKAADKLAKYLEDESKGKLKLKIYPDSQLGDDREMLEQLTAGQLDIAFAESGRLGLWVKEAEIFQLPYAFENFNHLTKVLFDSDAGKKLLLKLKTEKGWIVVADAYNGTRQTTSNKKIEKIEDMKGMKLRVPNAQANLNFAKYIGASPTPMAFTEVYLALQTNAVDGQENPLSAVKTSKFYEVQKYIALTNHILNDQCYIVSEKTLNKLPEDLKIILERGVKEVAKYHTELFLEDEKNLITFFKEQGIEITTPNLENINSKMQPIYDEYLLKNGAEGKELYEAIKANR